MAVRNTKDIPVLYKPNNRKSYQAIFLYGGSSKLRGLSNYFQHVLNLPTMNVDEVNIIKPTKNVKILTPDTILML